MSGFADDLRVGALTSDTTERRMQTRLYVSYLPLLSLLVSDSMEPIPELETGHENAHRVTDDSEPEYRLRVSSFDLVGEISN